MVRWEFGNRRTYKMPLPLPSNPMASVAVQTGRDALLAAALIPSSDKTGKTGKCTAPFELSTGLPTYRWLRPVLG